MKNLILVFITLFVLLIYKNEIQKIVYSGNVYQEIYTEIVKENIVCKAPQLSLENDTLKHLFHDMPPLNCTGDNLLLMAEDGQLLINKTVLNSREIEHCTCYPIEWMTDYSFKFLTPIVITKEPFAVKVNHDFFKVQCYLKTANLIKGRHHFKQEYTQYFAHVVPKTVKKKNIQKDQLNVLIIGLDSMSHLSYQRKLPKTYNYLKKKLGAVILNGYNIVADATLGAILPITTGKLEEELPNLKTYAAKKRHIDVLPLIWKEYEANGYVTMFSEDQPGIGTFQFRFRGFKEQPTDHYMRTFWLAADTKSSFCLGNRPKYQYQLDYVNYFFQRYKDVPKFAYSFFVRLAHSNNNLAEYIDSDFMELLKSFKNSGKLDNTVLVVMADHGPRYGEMRDTPQGTIEERMPMMSFLFPQWFKERYGNYYRNLEQNANKLSTPFDIHKTLQDIGDLTRLQLPVSYNTRAISLLRPIPSNRTCASAGVGPHWCVCLNLLQLNMSHERVQQGAQVVVDYINSYISDHQDQCVNLTLGHIEKATMVIPDKKVYSEMQEIDMDEIIDKYTEDKHIYQIGFTTLPNKGTYEATVEYNTNTQHWYCSGQISRTNQYNNEPFCIEETYPYLRKYCFCKQHLK